MYTKIYIESSVYSFTISIRTITLVSAMLLVMLATPAHSAQIPYEEDTLTDFPNPERGFFGVMDTAKNTVIRKYIYLNAATPASAMTTLRQEFDKVRKSKKKLIPRFNFSNITATAKQITDVIEQFKPVFFENEDVTAVVEAGLIGPWGEWRPTSGIPANDYASKKIVLDKLLEIVPKGRNVALRYNADKRGIYGTNAPITLAEAFNQSNRSRTAAHSDCFLADENSAGTYQYLGDRGGTGLGIEAEKTFLNSDNLFVSQHGETCEVGGGSYANCQRALADLPRMRWDILNDQFFNIALNTFKSEGCYTEISKHLGYRIVLDSNTIDDDVSDGNLDASISLRNVGYGKIFNPRKVELVLRSAKNDSEYILPTNIDPRFWSPGLKQTLKIKVGIPRTIPFGNYTVYLSLQDPAPKLYGIPEYAIRFANKNLWEPTKGYNSLNHTVKISSFNTNPVKLQNILAPKKNTEIKVFQGHWTSGAVDIIFNSVLSTHMHIAIYSFSGSLVKDFSDLQLVPGEQHLQWNRLDKSGRMQGAGLYFLKFTFEGSTETRAVLIK